MAEPADAMDLESVTPVYLFPARLGRYNETENLICACGEIGIHDGFRERHDSAFIPCKVRQVKQRTKIEYAPVAELADALDLGSNFERSAGSIPVGRTI